MQLDLWLPTASPMTTPELLDAVAQGAEERGIGTIWVGEHVVLFPEYASSYPYAEDGRIPAPPGSGLLEPLVTLTYLAARTSTVRLGTAMLLLPQRNPVYVAKEVSTLDWLSGGRVDLGVGVGWLKEEFEALNVPWERRGRRTDEYLEVLHTLWVDDSSSFHGELYDLDPCEMFPKPVQQPVPVHIGGETPAALRRVARAAQGWHTFNRTPEELATGLAELDAHLEAAGRSRADLRITVCPYFKPLTPEGVEQYAEAGADAVAALFFAFTVDDVAKAFDDLDACREVARRVSADTRRPGGPTTTRPYTRPLWTAPPTRCPPTRPSACSPTPGPGWSTPSTSRGAATRPCSGPRSAPRSPTSCAGAPCRPAPASAPPCATSAAPSPSGTCHRPAPGRRGLGGRPVPAPARRLREARPHLHQAGPDRRLGRRRLPARPGGRVQVVPRPGPGRAVAGRRAGPDRGAGATPQPGLRLGRAHPAGRRLHRPGPRGHAARRHPRRHQGAAPRPWPAGCARTSPSWPGSPLTWSAAFPWPPWPTRRRWSSSSPRPSSRSSTSASRPTTC